MATDLKKVYSQWTPTLAQEAFTNCAKKWRKYTQERWRSLQVTAQFHEWGENEIN